MNFNSEFKIVNNIIDSVLSDMSLGELRTPQLDEVVKTAKNAISELQKENHFQPQELKNRVTAILKNLSQEIEGLKLNSTAINRINARLTRTAALFPAENREKPVTTHVDVKLAIISNIDSPDHNGALGNAVKNAISSKIPFITSRTVLTGVELSKEEKEKKQCQALLKDINQLVTASQKEWSIFQKKELGDDGRELEVLIFIPLPSPDKERESEILRLYDFKTDGSLIKILPEKALSAPSGKADLSQFIGVFDPNPQKTKLLYLTGHGGEESPGGLSKDGYEAFLEFSKTQKCLGLIIGSCYSGGKSSLLNMPKLNKEGKKESLPFPVLVRSIGDIVTFADTEENYAKIFDQLEEALTSPAGQTIGKFRQMAKNAQNGLVTNAFDQNLNQIYFPHSPDSPLGFRPIGENSNNYSLTFGKMQRNKIENHSKGSDSIEITERTIELHPLIIDTPLTLNNEFHIFLSLIPGNAHHYLQKVTMRNPFESLKKIPEMYVKKHMLVSKGFFINSLTDYEYNIYRPFVFMINNNGMEAIYFDTQKQNYFTWNGEQEPKPISAFQFACRLSLVNNKTKPSDIAVRTQTAGQQEDEQFQALIKDEKFCGTAAIFAYSYLSLIKSTKNLEEQEILVKDIVKMCNEEEHLELVIHLIDIGCENLASRLFSSDLISLDILSSASLSQLEMLKNKVEKDRIKPYLELAMQKLQSGDHKVIPFILACGELPDVGMCLSQCFSKSMEGNFNLFNAVQDLPEKYDLYKETLMKMLA